MELYWIIVLLTVAVAVTGVQVKEAGSTVLSCVYDLPDVAKLLKLSWSFQPTDGEGTTPFWSFSSTADSKLDETELNKDLLLALDVQRVNSAINSHSIELRNIPVSLDGTFSCKVWIAKGQSVVVVGNDYRLVVTVRPDPQVVFVDPDTWMEDEVVHVDCLIERTKPMTDYDMHLEGHASIQSLPQNQTLGTDSVTYSVTQRNAVRLSWQDNGVAMLRCVVSWNMQSVVSKEQKRVTSLQFSPKQSPYHPDHAYATKDEPIDVEFFFYANPNASTLDTQCIVKRVPTADNADGTLHLHVGTVHIEKVSDADFREHTCEVSNSVGDDAKLHVTLSDITMKNAGLVTGVVVGLLCVVIAVAIIIYVVWKKRNEDSKPMPESSSVSFMKEQNGNYEPYCELEDQREKKVTPQRPIPAKRPIQQVRPVQQQQQQQEDPTYELVDTNLKYETKDNPKPVGTIYSEVNVNKLPLGEKPMVIKTVPSTEYTAVQFNGIKKAKHEDTDSD